MIKNIILLGSGPMAIAYANVLNTIGCDYKVIGRGEVSAKEFNKFIKNKVYLGGITENKVLFNVNTIVINAVNVENLYETTLSLIEQNVKKILIEKPGSLSKQNLINLMNISQTKNVDVYVAYNRRFYNSVYKVLELIEIDGGLKACVFEFTEYSDKIKLSKHHKSVKSKWLIANSSHVIDLAFFISGFPKEISAFVRKGDLSWHKSGSGFCGAGVTDKGVLFNYNSNWDCPGRWSIELVTNKRRILLSPMEKVKQKFNQEEFQEIKIDNLDDFNHKPGVLKLVNDFLKSHNKALCNLEQQIKNIDIYNKMAGYL